MGTKNAAICMRLRTALKFEHRKDKNIFLNTQIILDVFVVRRTFAALLTITYFIYEKSIVFVADFNGFVYI